MNQIIPINIENERQTVSARALWEFLNKPYEEFPKWFNKFKEYGFEENEDFRELRIKIRASNGAEHDATDYEITVDMGKELSMLQRTEKGKQARKYFIEAEKTLKESQKFNVSELSPNLQLLNHMLQQMVASELEQKETKRIALEAKTGLEETKQVINSIKDTMAELPKDQWRSWVNRTLNEIVKASNLKHNEIRNESYKLLEERGRANLSARLRLGIERLKNIGATKTKISNYCKLDCIEDDARLKEIYTSILKELRIKYLV